ncbi:proline-rich domain-containing protein [Glycomyces sp. NRRL B-16210]|uniref:proline-rich domain-containing protein n=1 Tax=Glycomyces sp. NRRL B-16210 TaxID=1463821 RepID=UPI00105F56AC|nr:proline-rich domain-containing protein [Glycomyces sp. NRRL B-16210]
MTTYNCPRCGRPSTAERCASCGRGPEPLLSRLSELDAVLAAMPATLQSRAAVETERRGVLGDLAEVAARYRAEAQAAHTPPGPQAPGPAPTTPAVPGRPVSQSGPETQGAAEATPPAPAAQPGQGTSPLAPGAPTGPHPAGRQTPQAPASPQTPTGAAPQHPTPAATPHGAPQPPNTPPGGAPAAPAYPMPPGSPYAPKRDRGEVGTKTVQTVLLSLGGLLVAAAIIIFTAVAWRNLGDGGRAAILGGVTLLLLAVPFAFKRFRLWATAETFAALASLALWCTTLAGYYLYRPEGADFGPETVGTWTAGVLAVLALYRAWARLSATSWALLPLAAVGASFAAASSLGKAVVLMLTIALVLGAAAWITANRPAPFGRSDLWASRFLTCAAVVAGCSAGLRAAFGLDGPVVPPVAAAVALLAAANLIGVHFARRLGVSPTTMLVAASAAGSLVLCAWTLAIRSASAELVIPSLALLAAALLPLILLGGKDAWPLAAAATAGLTALAAFAAVTFDAPDLAAYLVVFLAARLIAPRVPEPMAAALRTASYVVGAGTALTASIGALGGLAVLAETAEPGGLFTWETPIVLAALAFASVLLPRRYRLDAVALAVTFAVVSTVILVWHGDPVRFDALPTFGFIVCAIIGLTTAIGSGTLAGRCTGWVAVTVWAPITAGSAAAIERLDVADEWIPLWLTATAALMLVAAVGVPRKSRPDRVLAAILAHVLAGFSIGIAGLAEWLNAVFAGDERTLFVPAQFGIYTLALAGAAIMAPVRKWGYTITALCTGTLGWWTLLAALDVTVLEAFTAPPAAILFAIGLWRLERRPQAGSWSTLALPIIGGIGPSLILALGDADAARRVGVGAAAIVVIIAGLQRRWQAPLLLGSIALAVVTINELTLLWHLIPVWIPPAIGGVILIGAGATFEKRRRDLARIRSGLKSMR